MKGVLFMSNREMQYAQEEQKWWQKTWFIVLMIFLFFPVKIFIHCAVLAFLTGLMQPTQKDKGVHKHKRGKSLACIKSSRGTGCVGYISPANYFSF